MSRTTGSVPRRRLRVGLRSRVTIAFGLLALTMSAGLASLVGLLVTHYLLQQKDSSAVFQTSLSAETLRLALQFDHTDIPADLDATPSNDRTSSLLDYSGSWYTTSLKAGPTVLPAQLVSLVGGGTAATQRILIGGQPLLVVGTPIGARGDAYYELFSLTELDRTDRTLTDVLAAAALLIALVGLLLGRLASGRVLRPLAELTQAASNVARGNLDVRLDAEDDPDIGELAQSFNQTTEALQRRVAADARFAGDVSHELRTPLTTMLNSLALLQNRRDELPPAVSEPLDLLAEEMQRFRRLVVDLIEISRDESGPRADEGAYDSVLIADLVRAAADRAAGRPVTVVFDGAADLRVRVDKRRLERVVVDLVENAEAHGGGCVGVGVSREDGQVRITVDDAGPGVPPGRRDRVFERFARDPAAATGGVGLGLAIVQRHVQWHGGRVDVADRPGGGARFVVRLPILRGAS
jgi:signal transduction histidine kinase